MSSTRVTLLVGAVVALAAIATACGQPKHASTVQTTPAVASNLTPPAAQPAATTPEPVSPSQVHAPQAVQGESPDVVADIVDTLVTPGSVVEITAEGSSDITAVALQDGLGRRQAFAYDTDARVWRVSYRVPMRIPGERMGLSVTARNDAGRWHRVWVFVRTRDLVEDEDGDN